MKGLLNTLARYNSRHSLYLERGKGIALNPITSRSHDAWGGRTYRVYEPAWLWRLRQRVFAFAGNHRCASRDGSIYGRHGDEGTPDQWHTGPDGVRTCSFCGSMHFDDFLDIARKTITDPGYSVSRAKGYKFYAQKPGVRNASEGAIKFYTWHLPEHFGPRLPDALADIVFGAAKLTHERVMARIDAMREGRT